MTALRKRGDETWLDDLNEYGRAKFEEDYADQESAVGRNGRRAFAAGWTTMAARSKLWSYFTEAGRARRQGPPAKAVTDRSRLEKSAPPALSFPDLTKLRAYPFLKAEDVPKVPQIYAMVSLKDHAARVGSCADNGQFRKHATPGWLEDMHRENRRNANVAANLNRACGPTPSSFCWDARRHGAKRFVYVILESGSQLEDRAEREHREQLYMDALRDQTDWEDYTGRAACPNHKCLQGGHPVARTYVRRKLRKNVFERT
jgi:hypothetical protein